VAGIDDAAATGNSSTITEMLTNSGTTAIDVPYIIIPTSVKGCAGPSFTYTVTVNARPGLPTTTDLNYCQGMTGIPPLTAGATGSNTLLWYTTASGGIGTSIAPTPSTLLPGATAYYVSQLQAALPSGTCEGPRAPLTVMVSPVAFPSIGILADNGAICKGSTTTASTVTFTALATNTGSNPLYIWTINGNDVDSSTSNTYTTGDLALGNNTITCTVKVTTTSGCYSSLRTTSSALSVEVYQAPTISLSTLTPIIEQGGSAVINGVVTPTGTSFTWSAAPDDNDFTSNSLTPTVMPTRTTVYTLTVPPSGGAGVCPEISDTISIKVFIGNDFLMPNAFSPNGDGKDDIFRIPPSVSFDLTSFMIFDRWGIKVFETSDITKGWDGMYDNKLSDIATYVYVITGNGLTGKVFKKGTVVLVR
jgi:gliding motility-associated-like protein